MKRQVELAWDYHMKCQCTRQQYFRIILMRRSKMAMAMTMTSCVYACWHLTEGGSPSTLFGCISLNESDDWHEAHHTENGKLHFRLLNKLLKLDQVALQPPQNTMYSTVQLKCNMNRWREFNVSRRVVSQWIVALNINSIYCWDAHCKVHTAHTRTIFFLHTYILNFAFWIGWFWNYVTIVSRLHYVRTSPCTQHYGESAEKCATNETAPVQYSRFTSNEYN